jgi:putative ABC transport system permease protein
MTTLDLAPQAASPRSKVGLALSLAVRELRSGIGGFYVFIACVALGVAVITGVGALSDGLREGFQRQGEMLLGGDVTLARPHKRADQRELAWLHGQGRLSETATLRAMAHSSDGSDQTLVELKGIDGAYPLVGQVQLSGNTPLGDAMAGNGAAVDPILLERLRLKIGDTLHLGRFPVVIRATVAAEPDKLSDRLTFGPRVFISLSTLDATGLAAPGSLVRWRYALKLAGATPQAAATDPDLTSFRERLKATLPETGFSIADRRDPSPRVSQTLERLRQFLTLIGLTALLIGGVGVANAVATYIDRRLKVIATFRSLGASGGLVFRVHILQVMLIAVIGIALGLAAGTLIPLGLYGFVRDVLPIEMPLTVSVRSVATALVYGTLVTLAFTLWPLGRAGQVRAAVLFRDEAAPDPTRPPWLIMLATAACIAALATFAILTSESRRIALYFCGGLAGTLLVFWALGWALTLIARRLPRPRNPEAALAITNLGAPGGLTRSVVLSLGAGLSLLVAVSLADTSIVDELQARLPKQSPNYFVLDLPKAELQHFDALVRAQAPAAKISQAPMLRGRLVSISGQPVETIKAPPEAQWVLAGDRGLTYADTVPEGSHVTKGTWWPADYAGEPLVSFEAEIARHLNIDVGDRIVVNVLGRNISARVANLRDVKWESLAINFVMVFSPNTLQAAPHNLLATISLPTDTPLSVEANIARSVGKALPSTTTIRVRDAINAFNTVFSRIMTAIRVAGAVTLLAGSLVLAGALATAQRRRIHQAALLKVIGATRRRILLSHMIEYIVLALTTGLIAIAIGTASAWVALTRVMDLSLVFSWVAVAQALGIALALVAIFGLVGSAAILSTPTAPRLRSP